MTPHRVRGFKRRVGLRNFVRLCGLAVLATFLAAAFATAETGLTVDRSAQNLMVVLRESTGANKQDEGLKPLGKLRVQLPDGSEKEFELAAFAFLGDMHIRFVFDAPTFMSNATPQDLARLQVNPAQALELAVRNIKRVYGDPIAKPFTGGIMQVEGKSPDLDSSYFLDRGFWRDLLRQHPEGILAAAPKRGSLLFAPMNDGKAVDVLRNGISYLYSSSGHMRVSSALYLFKDDHWTVFQPPQAQ